MQPTSRQLCSDKKSHSSQCDGWGASIKEVLTLKQCCVFMVHTKYPEDASGLAANHRTFQHGDKMIACFSLLLVFIRCKWFSDLVLFLSHWACQVSFTFTTYYMLSEYLHRFRRKPQHPRLRRSSSSSQKLLTAKLLVPRRQYLLLLLVSIFALWSLFPDWLSCRHKSTYSLSLYFVSSIDRLLVTFSPIFWHVSLGRVLTQNSPVMPPRTITLSEPHNTSIQSIPGKKIAISPLKTPSKVNFSHYSSFTKQMISFLFFPAMFVQQHNKHGHPYTEWCNHSYYTHVCLKGRNKSIGGAEASFQHCFHVTWLVGSDLRLLPTVQRMRILWCEKSCWWWSSLFFWPCQVTVVSVASPTSNASQKSVTLPVNVALGQQILTVQQPTSASPVKVATSQATTQVR